MFWPWKLPLRVHLDIHLFLNGLNGSVNFLFFANEFFCMVLFNLSEICLCLVNKSLQIPFYQNTGCIWNPNFLYVCISIRGPVRRFIRRSIGPSVCCSAPVCDACSCAKTAVSDVFGHCQILHWPILNQMIDKSVMRATLAIWSFHLSVRPSVSPWTFYV